MTPSRKEKWKCPQCYKNPVQASPKKNVVVLDTPSSDNITIRKNKCIINVSTENSFDSLPDDVELDSSISPTPTTPELNRSCPELTNVSAETIHELQNKINMMQKTGIR